MDRLQSMRVFAKVVEQGSFVAAGSALGLSNAVVTRHLADLERHLGARLLNRTTRRLSLTETGHAYLDKVRQILQDVDDADAIATSQATRPVGALRIYCHVGFGQLQLAQMLPDYALRYPDVTLDVMLSDRTVDLVEEGFDVGIFIGLQKFDASMIARKIASSEIILCASPSYVTRHGMPQEPPDISQHACLNFAYEQLRHHWTIEDGTSSREIPITSRVISNNGALLRECALAGMGIALRSTFMLGDDLAAGRLVRLLPQHHLGNLGVMLVYPSRRLVSAKVRSFIDFISARYPHPESDPWRPD